MIVEVLDTGQCNMLSQPHVFLYLRIDEKPLVKDSVNHDHRSASKVVGESFTKASRKYSFFFAKDCDRKAPRKAGECFANDNLCFCERSDDRKAPRKAGERFAKDNACCFFSRRMAVLFKKEY